jgi:hypothetical protein
MEDDTQSGDQCAAEDHEKNFWCNFCGFTSDHLDDYLAHSCIEVLAATGQKVAQTGQTECR